MSEENQSHEQGTPEAAPSHLGPMLGVLVVVLVLILGGLYLWGAAMSNDVLQKTPVEQIENNEPETPRSDADVRILETVSPSDELDAIESDLESTNLDNIDSGLDEIDQELDAALN